MLTQSIAWEVAVDPEVVLTIVVGVGFVPLVLVVNAVKQSRLNDPSNTRFIHSAQMFTSHQLGSGPASAILMRQSGNEYRDLGLFPSSERALEAVEASFRRAGIDSVSVLKNSPGLYEVIRLHHSHGGKAEGQKLGGAILRSVQGSAPVIEAPRATTEGGSWRIAPPTAEIVPEPAPRIVSRPEPRTPAVNSHNAREMAQREKEFDQGTIPDHG
jgi:hypothetical protein